MKNFGIFVLLGLIVLASSQRLWLDTRRARYSRYDDDWNLLDIPCQGGSSLYKIKVYDLPSNWDFKDNMIYLRSKPSPSGRFQFRIDAQDLIYKISTSQYLVAEFKANDYQSFSVYPRSTYDPSYNIGSTYLRQERAYYQPSQNSITVSIQQGDITQINGIIRKIIDSQNDCEDKRRYLTLIINRIQYFLGSYQSGISTLRAEIIDYERQIISVKKQLAILESSVNKQIYGLRDQLRSVEAKIVYLRKQLRDDQEDIQQYTYEKKQILSEIYKIQNKIPDLIKQKKELEYKLVQIKGSSSYKPYSYSSYSYYSKNYWNNDYNRIQDSIERVERQIEYLKSQIYSLKAKVSWIEKKIVELSSRKSITLSKISQYEALSRRLQQRIKKAQYYFNYQEIVALKTKIDDLQSRIKKNQYEISVIETASAKLRDGLKTIRMLADQVYYRCEDYGYESASIVDNTFQVVFTPNTFRSYVQNSYGVNIYDLDYNYGGSSYGSYTRPNYRSSSSISIRRSNLFSPNWVSSYGNSYGYGQYRYGTNLYSSNNSFSCRRDGGRYRGRIKRISGNNIWVNYNNYDHQLVIGDCTTLETSTGYSIPRVNDYIIWTGTTPSPRTHYVYSGICI